MSKGHVLITGGAGFIGSHLADYLLECGFEVSVLDNLTPQVHKDHAKDGDGWPLYLSTHVRRIYGDAGDAELLRRSLKGVTHLVHLAASVGVGQSMADIVGYTRNNTMVAANVLQVLSDGNHSVERIAVASSMSVYGEGAYRQPSTGALVLPPLRDVAQLKARRWELVFDDEILEPVATAETKPLEPASVYAINKRDHEELFLVVGNAIGIPTIALRLFNVYGSRQALSNPYTGVAAIFMSRLMNFEQPLVFEDGNQMRDFIDVHDVARAFETVLSSTASVWDMFNVGTGKPVTVTHIAQTLAGLLGRNTEPVFLNKYRVGDIRHCYADASKIKDRFGFAAEVDFEEGMRALLEWVDGEVAVDRSEESMRELNTRQLVV